MIGKCKLSRLQRYEYSPKNYDFIALLKLTNGIFAAFLTNEKYSVWS